MMNISELRLIERGKTLLEKYNLELIELTGKEITRPKSALILHTAIVLGKKRDTGEIILLHSLMKGGVQLTTLEIFNEGHTHSLINASHDHWAIVIERAISLLEYPEPYNAFRNNCQHFTTYARIGRRDSETINSVILLLSEGLNEHLKKLFPDKNNPKSLE